MHCAKKSLPASPPSPDQHLILTDNPARAMVAARDRYGGGRVAWRGPQAEGFRRRAFSEGLLRGLEPVRFDGMLSSPRYLRPIRCRRHPSGGLKRDRLVGRRNFQPGSPILTTPGGPPRPDPR